MKIGAKRLWLSLCHAKFLVLYFNPHVVLVDLGIKPRQLKNVKRTSTTSFNSPSALPRPHHGRLKRTCLKLVLFRLNQQPFLYGNPSYSNLFFLSLKFFWCKADEIRLSRLVPKKFHLFHPFKRMHFSKFIRDY